MKLLKTDVDVEKKKLQLEYLFNNGVSLNERVIQLVPQKTEIDDSSEIDVEHFAFVDAALTELESYNRSAITIRICSYGGSVYAAAGIIGRLRTSKCKIITEGYGTIESAAGLILACGDERRISKFANYMHHSASLGIPDYTKVPSAEAQVAESKRLDALWAEWLAEFSTMPQEFFAKQGLHVDVYWTPDQLLEFGLVDKII